MKNRPEFKSLLRLVCCLAAMCGGLGGAPAAARAEEGAEILWYGADWAPAWIYEGDRSGQGYADIMQSLMEDALPDYRHTSRRASLVRLMRSLTTVENVCYAAAFYEWPDEETGKLRTDIVWTAPVYLFYWHGIAMRREQLPEFQAMGPLFLRDLLKRGDLRLGLLKGRVYGPMLDPILKDHAGNPNVLWQSAVSDRASNPYRLLQRGRVDYVIDYSFMMRFSAGSIGAEGQFGFLPLADHVTPYGLGAVACNNSPLGREVIARLNAAMPGLRRMEKFRRANSDWFMIPGREEEFWRLWNSHLMPLTE